MLSYIGKRILSLIPVLFVVSFVVFLVVYMIPGRTCDSNFRTGSISRSDKCFECAAWF